MDLVEFVKQNAAKFETIPDAVKTVEAFAETMKKLNVVPLANNVSDKDKPEYMPFGRFAEVLGERNELKKQVDAFPGQLDELKKAAGNTDELKKKIEQYEAEKAESDKRFSDVKVDAAIQIAAVTAKANDPGDLMKFIDKSKVSLDGDNIIGLSDQLKTLQESKPYLFAPSETPSKGNNGDATNTGGDPNQDYSKMSMEEFAKARGYDIPKL